MNACMYEHRYLPTPRRRHKRINQILVTGEFSIFELSKSKFENTCPPNHFHSTRNLPVFIRYSKYRRG